MVLRFFLLGVAATAALLGTPVEAAPWPGDYYAGVSYPVGYFPGYTASGFDANAWDYRQSWDYYPYGRYDYALNNYSTAPTTSSYVAYYPAPVSVPADNAARLAVRVPRNATLWFDNVPTRQTGSERLFVSPPLTPGRDYTYEIHGRWTEDGRSVDRTRRVHVRANTWAEVDMTQVP